MSFYASFDLKNPFYKKDGPRFKGIFHKHFRLSKMRNLEINCDRQAPEKLIDIALNLRLSGSDHAGPEFSISVLGWTFDIGAPDARHWDYENDCWLMYWKDFESEFQRILAIKDPDAEPVIWNNIWQFGESGLSPEEAVDLWIKNDGVFKDEDLD